MPAPKLLEDKVIIVTGASSGIGAATAVVLATHGAKVVLAARREEESAGTLAQVKAAGGDGTFIKTDVTDEAQVTAMVKRSIDVFGRLDAAFNNAGAGFPASADWPDNTPDQFDATFNLNVRGMWLAMKHELKAMIAAGGGSIVNNSSISGLRGGAAESYSASKAAVNSLTTSAAFKYGKQGIRVNAVAPGIIQTAGWQRRFDATPGMLEGFQKGIPLGRPGKPSEIGDVVAWLCSDLSTYVTGAVIPVDGGFTQTMQRP
jgi:NAD(P)-dependent dehydrogenase (short-subunit alcohol dehydrogenase family)